MILGLSHIALNCPNLDAATARLGDLGYAPVFEETGLENQIAKRPFLSQFHPKHDIRYMASDSGMAVELLHHGPVIGPQTLALIPVFRSAERHPDWELQSAADLPFALQGWRSLCRALKQKPAVVRDPVLAITFLWIADDEQPPGLSTCVLPTDDIETTVALLKQLRFRSNDAGVWSLLTPVATLQASLIPVDSSPNSHWNPIPLLDAPGCACIALMARNMTAEGLPDALQENSVSFTLTVNGKPSRITLALPKTGPVFEFIEQVT